MNPVLNSLVEEVSPKFNNTIIRGYAEYQIPHAMEFIDNVIRSRMRSVLVDLTYEGYRYLKPEEEFESNISNAKAMYDVAGSDVRKVELIFKFKGEKLTKRYLYLPFVRDGGIMTISGTKFYLAPVLTDSVISPNDKQVFVKLMVDKLLFKSNNYQLLKNNAPHIGQISFSEQLYRNNNTEDNLGKVVTPVGVYLFGRFGFTQAFLKYGNSIPIITNDINHIKELSATHDIFSSNEHKMRILKSNRWTPHGYSICIKKDSYDTFELGLIHSFLYTLDIFPERAGEIVNAINSTNVKSEKVYWKILIGRLIFKDAFSHEKCYGSTEDHFNNLESYIDEHIKQKLADVGHYVDDFFDFLALLITNFTKFLTAGKAYSNNVDNRYIDVLYYILYDIVYNVNRTVSEINKLSQKIDLTTRNIQDRFKRNLSSRLIYSISKSTSPSLSLTLAETSNDSLFLKVTSLLELQERGKGVKRGDSNNAFPENTRMLVGSDFYLGNILYLPKSHPTPKARINPMMTFDKDTGKLTPDENARKTIALLDRLFANRVIKNDNINELMDQTEDAEAPE